MLSYFTLPNSNHERKSSPIEKIVFCIRSILTGCLRNHRSKFAGQASLISNSSGRSAGVIGDGSLVARFSLAPRVRMMRPPRSAGGEGTRGALAKQAHGEAA